MPQTRHEKSSVTGAPTGLRFVRGDVGRELPTGSFGRMHTMPRACVTWRRHGRARDADALLRGTEELRWRWETASMMTGRDMELTHQGVATRPWTGVLLAVSSGEGGHLGASMCSTMEELTTRKMF